VNLLVLHDFCNSVCRPRLFSVCLALIRYVSTLNTRHGQQDIRSDKERISIIWSLLLCRTFANWSRMVFVQSWNCILCSLSPRRLAWSESRACKHRYASF